MSDSDRLCAPPPSRRVDDPVHPSCPADAAVVHVDDAATLVVSSGGFRHHAWTGGYESGVDQGQVWLIPIDSP